MPLKIESGTYTVNPVAKKNVSKFLLWKHWRRSVHEERGDEDRRRASGQTRGGGEVAGLEDVGDCCAATLTPSVPGAAGIRSNRRIRPLSLAVQPLNYRRLDPDPKIAIDVVTSHHPNMTSQESIGSCSLDVDQSASDRSENTVDTISKKTLHSLNLSCNGDSVSSPNNLANGSSETLQKSHLTPDEKLNVSNGNRSSPEPEQLTVKKPSYLGLACSISGYSGINRYDSKLREGFRSRDSSPGTRLITRDTSPAGFRSNENLNVHPYPPKSQSISPLAMDRQNGFSNGLKEECKVEAYRETRNSISICQGYSEVDKGVMHSGFADISPIRPTTPAKRSPGMSQMMSCSQQNKHFSGSSPKQATANISNTSFSDTSILNGSSVEIENQVLSNSSSSEKSFIQQRVERLYGPGALAQGFFFKRSTSRLNSSDTSFNKSSNNNDVSTENANTEESLKNLPVLRHLRPEFRAQLPVVSPRRPTDGSEQILKPLQRVTPVSRKVEQKPKIPAATKLDGNLADSGAQKLNSSVTSIPDQQPAAPKVVLPVLEPSASSSNVVKQVQEAEKTAEEKNGHYFMKLLKQETDRLLSLAASAEAELASGDTVALPEEAAGKLRSAAGKARLLASQKMQQFEGLCQKNIIQVPGEEFPTTNEDLAGFWDMVMLQVVQVNELFDHIEKLRNSQWQETVPEKKAATAGPQNGSTVKRRVTPIHKPKSTANSEANKKAREARELARRQLIEERRRAMRSNAQNSENTVKIFAPDT
ncbi:Disks large-associated protein 1 [Habropoda laboriosa]|uniref:Disks large-associated protein 1 n=1 Tax=Habropoda laboriosa TaxID=597456 RepID=A0A0L7R6I6_9HYME|nr:Disks large-associated protein 1 [Habropoda laboriosa]